MTTDERNGLLAVFTLSSVAALLVSALLFGLSGCSVCRPVTQDKGITWQCGVKFD